MTKMNIFQVVATFYRIHLYYRERLNGIFSSLRTIAIYFNRIAIILLLYSGVLATTLFSMGLVGSGVGVFGSLFQVTHVLVEYMEELFSITHSLSDYVNGCLILSSLVITTQRVVVQTLMNYQLSWKLRIFI